MQNNLKETIDLFVANKETVQKAFKWDSSYMHPLCSLMYTSIHEKINIERMKEAEQLIKSKTGIFSEFRGNTRIAMMTQMALADDMGSYFDAVKSVYEKLNAKKWFSSEYRIVAAMVIAQNEKDESKYDALVDKTYELMAHMRENHPWLTGDEDTGFAALLAVSGLQTDNVVAEMEKCYQILKGSKRFSSANGIQSLSHALSLELGNSEEKCKRVIDIYDGLKAKKKKYGQTYELSTLGSLAFADVEVTELVEQIAEADDYLKTQKGFGAFGIGGAQRLMYASMLVLQQYTSKVNTIEAAALNGIVAIIIAEEAALLAAITAAVVVNSSN